VGRQFLNAVNTSGRDSPGILQIRFKSQDPENKVGLLQPLLHEKSGALPTPREPLIQVGFQAFLL